MTNRRVFLGAALAATAAGGVGLAGDAGGRAGTVAFYPRKPGATPPTAGLFGGAGVMHGRPERVGRGSLAVGHFHGLVHEGEGKVLYLYKATLADRRSGYVKLDEAVAAFV